MAENPPAKEPPPTDATPAKKNDDDEEKQEDTLSPLYDKDKNEWNTKPAKNDMRVSMLRSVTDANENRRDHFQQMMKQKRASMHYVMQAIQEDASRAVSTIPDSVNGALTSTRKKELDEDTLGLKEAVGLAKKLQSYYPKDDNRVGIRLKDFSYEVNVNPNSNKIQTVFNQSCVYDALKWWKILIGKEERPKKERQFVLKDVNLDFQPGKMYLILGPPRSGKTTLLKAIAGRLPMEQGETMKGSVEYNGVAMQVCHFALLLEWMYRRRCIVCFSL